MLASVFCQLCSDDFYYCLNLHTRGAAFEGIKHSQDDSLGLVASGIAVGMYLAA
jgi:hypothetical protein